MAALVDTRIEEYIVIVDGMGTAKYLAPAFISLGYPCIHIENKVEHHPLLSLSLAPPLYCKMLEYYGDLDALVHELKDLPIRAIVPGGETGVQLAIELSRAVSIPFEKGLHPASVFRDKYQLYSLLKQLDNGYLYKIYSSFDNFHDDMKNLTSKLPLVIKPRTGALAFGVSICETYDDLISGAERAFEINDPFNRGDSPSILVMSKIEGTEFMVNTVSARGTHKIREVWRMQKKNINGVPAYYIADFVPPNDDVYNEITDLLSQSMDTIGVIDGPCHIELIKPESKPPIIIDFGYRLQGMLDPSFPFSIYGSSTLLDATKCIIDKELIDTLVYKAKIKSARNVTLHVSHGGVIDRDIDWSIISTIPGVHAIRKGYKRGDTVLSTDSGMNSFATVYLLAESPEEIEIITDKIFSVSPLLFQCINTEGEKQ